MMSVWIECQIGVEFAAQQKREADDNGGGDKGDSEPHQMMSSVRMQLDAAKVGVPSVMTPAT